MGSPLLTTFVKLAAIISDIGYSKGRIPIASTDFSTHKYTYDDIPGEINLTSFKLTPGDFHLKANYYVRFLQEYESQRIPIHGVTEQNEPMAGYVPFYRWQALGFPAKTQRQFVKLDLGPALAKAGYVVDWVKLMIIDDNRIILRKLANVILGEPEAAKYVSGVAVLWYLNRLVGPSVLDMVHQSFPGLYPPYRSLLRLRLDNDQQGQVRQL
ncbi:hypothetical protein MRX96_004710 [Rhipicephalus microplus]